MKIHGDGNPPRPESTKPSAKLPVWTTSSQPVRGPSNSTAAPTKAAGLTLNLGGGVQMDLITIPAGEFIMGSPYYIEGQEGWDVEPGPQHRVRIGKSFLLGKYPVTVAQFRQFVQATGHRTDAEKGGQAFEDGRTGGRVYARQSGWRETDYKGRVEWRDGVTWRSPGLDPICCTDPRQLDFFPVVLVSWNDAGAFCQWMSRQTGHQVRLPSEAQWEYACRAGGRGFFSFGDSETMLLDYGWCRVNSGLVLHPAGRLASNAWGLYDVHGNVAEWCSDCYHCDYKDATEDGIYRTPGQSDLKVCRGGSFISWPKACRSSSRGGGYAADRSWFAGFRVAVESR